MRWLWLLPTNFIGKLHSKFASLIPDVTVLFYLIKTVFEKFSRINAKTKVRIVSRTFRINCCSTVIVV